MFTQSRKSIPVQRYGMMCQRTITNPILYNGGDWKVNPEFDRVQAYADKIDHIFLPYQWGVWTTAWARMKLHAGIKIAESADPDARRTAFVYADTDSVKSTCKLDFSKFNAKCIANAKKSGGYATDKKGVTHYLGAFEDDGTYEYFKTLGAKRYCYVEDGELVITVAGVPKEEGSAYMERLGGIDGFRFGMVFPGSETGKTGAVYNDDIDEDRIVNGTLVHITRNVTIVNVDYLMKLYPTYYEMLEQCKARLDKYQTPDYNKKW